LEKIKTIGDAYMVVAGLPEPRADHAQAAAEMALDMQSEAGRLGEALGLDLAFRIGIDTGPVIAGVIGRRKFSYDLWGDTVNTASRMESHGLAGRIQVTATTHERLRSAYRFEDRGAVEVKGKGTLPTYLLLGRLDPPA
jgi:class 3 adenylate cyclase